MNKLSYIRHGLSEANKQVVFSGHMDTPLSPEGIEQAKLAGIEASKHDIDQIITSPLTRAFDTAKIVADVIGYPLHKIEVHELLMERYFGVLEGSKYSVELSLSLKDHPLPEGVESFEELTKRAKKLVQYVKKNHHGHVLLVGHGSIGRAIRSLTKPEIDVLEKIPNAQFERWI